MTEQQITLMETFQALAPAQQQEVIDFAEFLHQKTKLKHSVKSLKGLWADLDVAITEEDLRQARREMWGDFPRENIL